MTGQLVQTSDEIGADWLADVLGRPGVELASVAAIGTGQMSQSYRVAFCVADGPPETVVVKLASRNSTSRATGVGMGAYLREVAFYRNLAGRLGGPVPGCYLAEYDEREGWFTLVLEDAGATQGDQIEGCSVAEAELALRALAQVQAPVLGDLAVGASDWLNQPNPLTQDLLTTLLPAFLERYEGRVSSEHAAVCERFIESLDAWAADRRSPLGLVHGDYRLDNLLFSPSGCRVVDWQTVTWGSAMLDAPYFIGGGLHAEERREREESLVRLYHEELLSHGVQSLGWEQCWEDYRRQCFHGIEMTIVGSMVVVRTDRGDDMFMAWFERSAEQVLDLDALSLLPAPRSGPSPALRPDPQDEGRHPPGPEALWNESWYFDAVSDSGELGVYVRLGRVPNQGDCLYTACICGPGRPSVMLVDAAAPLPAADDERQRIETANLRAEQRCLEPLQRFSVRAEGVAQAYIDPSAPLRGESGEPLAVSIDLEWQTDGVPYAWRQSTRYEIPCRVTGTVRIGEEEIALTGPGQRDHSWGARDWWATDWMWSGLHLEDGTHTHAVGVPQMPGYGVGYVQRADALTEITAVTATAEVAPNGLITSARISSGPDELDLDIEPVAYGALRLEAPDGRISHFPRAMCRVRAHDGRGGAGWVEWNRVQDPDAGGD